MVENLDLRKSFRIKNKLTPISYPPKRRHRVDSNHCLNSRCLFIRGFVCASYVPRYFRVKHKLQSSLSLSPSLALFMVMRVTFFSFSAISFLFQPWFKQGQQDRLCFIYFLGAKTASLIDTLQQKKKGENSL